MAGQRGDKLIFFGLEKPRKGKDKKENANIMQLHTVDKEVYATWAVMTRKKIEAFNKAVVKRNDPKPKNTQLCIFVDFKQIVWAAGHGFPDLMKYIEWTKYL